MRRWTVKWLGGGVAVWNGGRYYCAVEYGVLGSTTLKNSWAKHLQMQIWILAARWFGK